MNKPLILISIYILTAVLVNPVMCSTDIHNGWEALGDSLSYAYTDSDTKSEIIMSDEPYSGKLPLRLSLVAISDLTESNAIHTTVIKLSNEGTRPITIYFNTYNEQYSGYKGILHLSSYIYSKPIARLCGLNQVELSVKLPKMTEYIIRPSKSHYNRIEFSSLYSGNSGHSDSSYCFDNADSYVIWFKSKIQTDIFGLVELETNEQIIYTKKPPVDRTNKKNINLGTEVEYMNIAQISEFAAKMIEAYIYVYGKLKTIEHLRLIPQLDPDAIAKMKKHYYAEP